MSENKDIQKVENDKDKIEYEKFHWEISAIKRFNNTSVNFYRKIKS